MSDYYNLPDDAQQQAESLEARRTEVLHLRDEIDALDSLLAAREEQLSQEIADLVSEHLEPGERADEQPASERGDGAT